LRGFYPRAGGFPPRRLNGTASPWGAAGVHPTSAVRRLGNIAGLDSEGGCHSEVDVTAGSPSAPEMPSALAQLRLVPQTDIAWSSAVPPGGKLAPPRSAVASDWLRSLGCRRGSWLTHSGVNVKARTTSSIWRPFFGDWPLNSHRLISTGIASSPMKLARSTGWYRQVAN